MVVDIKLSSDSVAEFQEQLKVSDSSLPISFSTLVLQSAAWPLVQSANTVVLPEVLTNAIKKVYVYIEFRVHRVGQGNSTYRVQSTSRRSGQQYI